MIKFFWEGPGYYAGYQYDTTYDGSGVYANYRMQNTDPHKASVEARERRLGTPRWYDTPPEGATVV